MTMRRSIPMLLIALMVFQTASLLVMDSAEAASGRGGNNDDFFIKKISIENSNVSTWVQSDQSTVDYLVMGQQVEVKIQVQLGGNSLTGKSAFVLMEIVHPIGYVIESSNFTTPDLWVDSKMKVRSSGHHSSPIPFSIQPPMIYLEV